MATWVIGDIQGCACAFETLLGEIDPDPRRDRIWLAGDLVNRGSDSLRVLRRAATLGSDCVLGNHDLHLLAVASGARPCFETDTFQDVLDAPDRDDLLDWLRRQPLVHRDPDLGWTMVHAGLPPQWDVATARERASEVERALAGPRPHDFLRHMYGDEAEDRGRTEWGRLRHTVNALTRIRYVTEDERLDFSWSGPPGAAPNGLVPWYAAPARRSRGEPIVFGHWATLALDPSVAARERIRHVDTGCVWGGSLTALELQSGRMRAVDCRSHTTNS